MALSFRQPIDNLCSLAVALGLDPEALPIRSITIGASVNRLEVTIVTLELVTGTAEHGRLVKVLKRFTLVPKDADG